MVTITLITPRLESLQFLFLQFFVISATDWRPPFYTKPARDETSIIRLVYATPYAIGSDIVLVPIKATFGLVGQDLSFEDSTSLMTRDVSYWASFNISLLSPELGQVVFLKRWKPP